MIYNWEQKGWNLRVKFFTMIHLMCFWKSGNCWKVREKSENLGLLFCGNPATYAQLKAFPNFHNSNSSYNSNSSFIIYLKWLFKLSEIPEKVCHWNFLSFIIIKILKILNIKIWTIWLDYLVWTMLSIWRKLIHGLFGLNHVVFLEKKL